ncbi:hypothetical protein F4814DRAFT_399456, partial [Daldinia grandis]
MLRFNLIFIFWTCGSDTIPNYLTFLAISTIYLPHLTKMQHMTIVRSAYLRDTMYQSSSITINERCLHQPQHDMFISASLHKYESRQY